MFPHGPVNPEGKSRPLLLLLKAFLPKRSGPAGQDVGQVAIDHDGLGLAEKNGRQACDRILLRHPLHQILGHSEERLVGCGVGTALLDQVLQQRRHLRVEPRVGELIADDGLADVVDDSLGYGVPRKLALLVQLSRDGIMDAGLDDQVRERE